MFMSLTKRINKEPSILWDMQSNSIILSRCSIITITLDEINANFLKIGVNKVIMYMVDDLNYVKV